MEKITFQFRPGGPERLVCDAEVEFGDGLFAGLKLVGFTLWRSAEGEIYVTVPSRSFGAGAERRFFDFVRAIDPNEKGSKHPLQRLKAAIVEEYHHQQYRERTGAQA